MVPFRIKEKTFIQPIRPHFGLIDDNKVNRKLYQKGPWVWLSIFPDMKEGKSVWTKTGMPSERPNSEGRGFDIVHVELGTGPDRLSLNGDFTR